MSYFATDTRNRIGVRKAYSQRALSGLGVHRAPAETPPVSGYFTTAPLPGDGYNTQASTHALGIVPNNDVSLWNRRGLILPTPVAIAAPAISTPVAVAAPAPSTQPTTQPTPWTQPNGGAPSDWRKNRSGSGWSASAVPATQPTQTGAASPPDAGTAAQAGTPIPFNWPINSPYTDANGNVWTYQNGQWAITSSVPASQPGTPTPTAYTGYSYGGAYPSGVALQANGPAAQTAQSGTPVPVGWPTSESYTDSNGNIWTYTTTAGWQVTGTTASQASLLAQETAAAAAAGTTSTAAGTTVTVAADTTWDTITTWLQSQTIWSGVPNFWLVAGAGAAGLVLYSMTVGRGRR